MGGAGGGDGGGDKGSGLNGGAAGGSQGEEVHTNSLFMLQPLLQQYWISSAVQSRKPCAAHSFAASVSERTPVEAVNGVTSKPDPAAVLQTEAPHEPPSWAQQRVAAVVVGSFGKQPQTFGVGPHLTA